MLLLLLQLSALPGFMHFVRPRSPYCSPPSRSPCDECPSLLTRLCCGGMVGKGLGNPE